MNTHSMQVYQDYEWAHDWEIIVKIFDTIDNLKSQFEQLDVTYLREIQQNILMLLSSAPVPQVLVLQLPYPNAE